MLTTTHVALAGALGRWSRRGEGRVARRLGARLDTPAARAALPVGGLLPDVPLVGALTYAVATAVIAGEPVGAAIDHTLDVSFPASDALVLAHVSLQAPLLLGAVLAAGLAIRRHPIGGVLRGLSVGALLHSLVDVFTHADEGPLLLFPFSWSVSYSSPLSWSEPARFGPLLLAVDIALSVALGGWLLGTWWRERRAAPDRHT